MSRTWRIPPSGSTMRYCASNRPPVATAASAAPTTRGRSSGWTPRSIPCRRSRGCPPRCRRAPWRARPRSAGRWRYPRPKRRRSRWRARTRAARTAATARLRAGGCRDLVVPQVQEPPDAENRQRDHQPGEREERALRPEALRRLPAAARHRGDLPRPRRQATGVRTGSRPGRRRRRRSGCRGRSGRSAPRLSATRDRRSLPREAARPRSITRLTRPQNRRAPGGPVKTGIRAMKACSPFARDDRS